MFIPPEGAMQFAWGPQHVWHGESVWVTPYAGPWEKKGTWGLICHCTNGYLVIKETEPPRVKKLSIDGRPKVVCNCVGGIIE